MKNSAVPCITSAGLVPPCCYLLPGMTVEKGAALAVKDMRISTLCDALALLWELRRVAAKAQMHGETDGSISKPNKPQPSAIAEGGEHPGFALNIQEGSR